MAMLVLCARSPPAWGSVLSLGLDVGSRRTSSAGRGDEDRLEAPDGEGPLLRVGEVKPSSTRVGQLGTVSARCRLSGLRLPARSSLRLPLVS
jgi:hypothetical protein